MQHIIASVNTIHFTHSMRVAPEDLGTNPGKTKNVLVG